MASAPAAAETEGDAAAPPDTLSLREAVRMTLSQQPEIRIAEQQVTASRAVLRQGLGQFDFNLQAGISQRGDVSPLSPYQQLIYGNGFTSINTYTTNYYAAVTKQFDFGMSTSASIQYNRIAQNALPIPYAQSLLVFSIVQPLLRGRGAASTAVTALSAKLQQEQSQLQLRHTISQKIQDSCMAYWSYAASHQAVGQWTEALARAQVLIDNEQLMVKEGEHPASSLKLLTANLAEVTAAAADAERQELQARQALGVAMGLPWDKLLHIGVPSENLISIDESRLPQDTDLSPLIQMALSRRADLLAARTAIRTSQILVRGAERGLDPRLDAEVDLGYAGIAEGTDATPFFSAPYQNVAGVNFFAGLSLQLPVPNNVARGALAQRQAELAQAGLFHDNLRRQIGAAVALVVISVRTALRSRKSADDAVSAYKGAVEDEGKKLRAGLSTIFDLVQVQSRLNSAEQSALAARVRLATLICQARFETGTLLSMEGAQNSVNLDQLTTFPVPTGSAP